MGRHRNICFPISWMEATMKINEAIQIADRMKPNAYGMEQKIRWLSTLDGIVKSEIIDTHEGGENVVYNGYNAETALTTELLVPAPYDDVYIRYLEMQIDYANGENAKYNNSRILYNETYTAFAKHYNSTHMPKGSNFKFF